MTTPECVSISHISSAPGISTAVTAQVERKRGVKINNNISDIANVRSSSQVGAARVFWARRESLDTITMASRTTFSLDVTTPIL
jgi:hypothetical protein